MMLHLLTLGTTNNSTILFWTKLNLTLFFVTRLTMMKLIPPLAVPEVLSTSNTSSTLDDTESLSSASASLGQATPALRNDDLNSINNSSKAMEMCNNLYPVSAQEVDLSRVQNLDEALHSIPVDNQLQRLGWRLGPMNYAIYHSTGYRSSWRGDEGRKRWLDGTSRHYHPATSCWHTCCGNDIDLLISDLEMAFVHDFKKTRLYSAA